MFESIYEKGRKGGVRSGRDVLNGLGCSVRKSKKSKRMTFYIGKNLMKRARIIIGDRLDILRDKENNLGLIKRVSQDDTRYSKLTDSGSCGSLSTTRFDKEHKETDGVISLENVAVDDEGILFEWPSK